MDENNHIIGKGTYSKLIRYKTKFLLKKFLKTKKKFYKIEVFFPYIPLASLTNKNHKKIEISFPMYPSLSFEKNFENNKQIVSYIVGLYWKINMINISNQIFTLQSQNKNSYFLSNITPEKRIKWVNYMQTIFKPYHRKMEKLILEKSYLVQDKKMKNLLNRLLFHIDGYKRVFSLWDKGDYSLLTSDINFPSDINMYTKKKINELRKILKSK